MKAGRNIAIVYTHRTTGIQRRAASTHEEEADVVAEVGKGDDTEVFENLLLLYSSDS